MLKFKKNLLVILVGLIIIHLGGCMEKTNNDELSNYKIERQENWSSINDEIFVSTDEENRVNVVLIKSGNEAALIDTGYNESQALRVKDYIDKNNLKLKNVIITHMHEDQKRNISIFKGDDVKITTPIGAENNQVITIGDKELKILHTPGHFVKNHISVELNDEILVAGDIVTTHENTPTSITYSNFKDLIETLEKLKEKKYSLIIPSHGDIAENNSIINETLEEIKNSFSKHKIIKERYSWTQIDDDIFVSTSNYYATNMILVTSGKEATLIDTGYNTPEAKAVKRYIDDNNLTLKNVIITHWHDDHDANLDMFTGDDIELLNYNNSSDNQIIEVGEKKLKIIHTPGHAEDVHLSVEVDEEILVAGDIILSSMSIVRSLQYGGNEQTLTKTLEELKKKNYSLIIPGHGDTCIGDLIIDEHILALKRYSK